MFLNLRKDLTTRMCCDSPFAVYGFATTGVDFGMRFTNRLVRVITCCRIYWNLSIILLISVEGASAWVLLSELFWRAMSA